MRVRRDRSPPSFAPKSVRGRFCMSRARGLPWRLVVICSLALATPGVGQEAPRGLDDALRGQVPKRVEPKRETPPVVLAPVFWSPSPTVSDFIRELRQTETADLPSADTLCSGADPDASTFQSKWV